MYVFVVYCAYDMCSVSHHHMSILITQSTLVNSILGEGRPLTGSELAVKGRLGCFLQSPFIMNDTVRNNILFGHEAAVDEERYKLALEVCSLSHDLKLLPHGDQTEIGEKGITLSGGQKARIALARAVYHDGDVYLLDDRKLHMM